MIMTKFQTVNFRKILSAVATVSLLVLTACSTRNGPPASVHYDQAPNPFHVVRKGESLSLIAKRYHLNKNELVRMNGLKPPYRIVVGQRLMIGAPAVAASGNPLDDSEAPALEPTTKSDSRIVQLQPLPGVPTSTAPVGAAAPTAVSGATQPLQVAATLPAAQASSPMGNEDNYQDGGMVDDSMLSSPQDAEEMQEPEKKGVVPVGAPPEASGSYVWPVRGKIVKDFAKGGKTQNDGLNISAPKGTPVVAVNNGVVAHAGNQLKGFGNVILVKHDKGLMTVYAHLDEVLVKRGDVVSAGQKIGTVGKSGTVKEPQLHFEIRKGTTPVDPKKHLS